MNMLSNVCLEKTAYIESLALCNQPLVSKNGVVSHVGTLFSGTNFQDDTNDKGPGPGCLGCFFPDDKLPSYVWGLFHQPVSGSVKTWDPYMVYPYT